MSRRSHFSLCPDDAYNRLAKAGFKVQLDGDRGFFVHLTGRSVQKNEVACVLGIESSGLKRQGDGVIVSFV